MSDPRPNPVRGELALTVAGRSFRIVPSFAALARAEEAGKPLFQLVEEAAAGRARLADMALLFHHCLDAGPEPPPPVEAVGEALAARGLAGALRLYRRLLEAALGLPDGAGAAPPDARASADDPDAGAPDAGIG